MRCAKCGREPKEIVLESVELTRVYDSTVIDVLYVSADDKIVCPTCVSENMIVLKYEGMPYIRYTPATKRVQGLRNIHIDTEPYPEEIEQGADIEEVARLEKIAM